MVDTRVPPPLSPEALHYFKLLGALEAKHRPSCECCDHPLQHAIRQALNIGDNEMIAKRGYAMDKLRDKLREWEST